MRLFEFTEFGDCNEFVAFLRNMLRYCRKEKIISKNIKIDIEETLSNRENRIQMNTCLLSNPTLSAPLQELKSYLQ